MGGLAPKKTTVELKVDDFVNGKKNFKEVKDSKELSRGAPGFMSMMASALREQVFNNPVVKQKELTWAEHAFRHAPYRRDCKVCQETLQHCALHRKVKDWRSPFSGCGRAHDPRL